MIKNKTEVALKILETQESESSNLEISTPPYIEEALKWIKEL